MTRAVTGLLVCLFFLPCGGTISASGISPARQSEEKPDPRLQQKISYSAKEKSVREACADLTKKTGVVIRAGRSDSDWLSRDRKINIFVKDVPLLNLMNSIARSMKFMVTRNEDDPPTYRMYMSSQTLAYAHSLRDQQQEQIKRVQAEGRASVVAALEKLRDITPEQVEALKKDDPGLYMYAATGIGQPLAQLVDLVPKLKSTMLSGDNLVFNAWDMTPEAQDALRKVIGSIGSYNNYRNGYKPEPVFIVSADFGKDLGRVTVHTDFIIANKQRSGVTDPISFIADITVFEGHRCFAIPLGDPQSDFGKMHAKTVIRSNDEKRAALDIFLHDPEWEKALAAECDRYHVEDKEEPDARVDDPSLKSEVKVTIEKDAELPDAVEALSKSETPVVSDTWGESRCFGYSLSGKVPLEQVIGKICLAYQLNWKKKTSIIEFLDKSWFTRLDYLVPEHLILKWSKTLKEAGTLDVRNLAEMSELSFPQLDAIADEAIKTSGAPRLAYNERNLLKACACLNPRQWNLVLSKGLDLASLSDDQWTAMGKCIVYKNAAFLQDADARLVFKGSRTRKDKHFEYVFTLTSSGDTPQAKWTLSTPEYKPTKQPAPVEK